jgi:hypothetical protein
MFLFIDKTSYIRTSGKACHIPICNAERDKSHRSTNMLMSIIETTMINLIPFTDRELTSLL